MAHLKQANRLRVYLFSYNRPQFLQNCVESIVTLIPGAALTVIDDDSEDRKTRLLLNRYAQTHQVLKPSTHAEDQTYKTGGLYANKTLALNDAIKHGADYALYMHDDQQIVRRVRDADLARFDRFFEANPRCLELHACFLKHDLRESDTEHTRIDATATAYFRDKRRARGHKHFSGSGLFHVGRVRACIGTFGLGEKINEASLREQGMELGFYAWPFMAWLPFPISYRGKTRHLSHRAIEWLGGGGFHPIDYLTGDAEQRFLDRDIAVRPVAEDLLVSPSAPKAEKWSTMGGFYNAGARRGFKKSVARLIWKWEKKQRDKR